MTSRRKPSGWRAVWTALPTVAKELTAFIGAAAALLAALAAIGVFDGDDDDGPQSAAGPTPTPAPTVSSGMPAVVTLRRSGYLTRGFVTPKRFIVTTRETREPGFEAAWSDAEGEHRAKVALAEPPGSVVPGAVTRVLGDEMPARVDFATRNAETLKECPFLNRH